MTDPTHTARDVAAWLLTENFQRVAEDEEGEEEYLTNLKLQKLLYYAQGAFLALDNRPLFHEPLVARQHGPAVIDVYETYKSLGGNQIEAIRGDAKINNFTEDEAGILKSVMNEFGGYTASQLRKMTHEETPWQEAIRKGKGSELDLNTIAEYFTENYI